LKCKYISTDVLLLDRSICVDQPFLNVTACIPCIGFNHHVLQYVWRLYIASDQEKITMSTAYTNTTLPNGAGLNTFHAIQ